MQLPVPLEASLVVKNENSVFFLGGRQDKDDSDLICEMDCEDFDDLSEIKEVGKLKNKSCLHKGVITDNYIIIIGGIEMEKIEVKDRKTLEPIRLSGAYIIEAVNRVSFNNTFVKRTSLI